MVLLDLTHTSHSRARTGIQRVTRALWREWDTRACPVCFDPYLGAWRELEPWELVNLAAKEAGGARGARWPLAARIRGRLRKLIGQKVSAFPAAPGGILVPEIFSPAVAGALPALFALSPGPRAALFHDAIALRLPELTPAKSVARFPAYLRELLAFDGIAAVSEDSRQSLLEHWTRTGAISHPPVTVIPLGVDPVAALIEGRDGRPRPSAQTSETSGANGRAGRASLPSISAATEEFPTLLCVSSIEGRKNHLALLEACENLWSRGRRFELHLIGLPRPETAAPALAKIEELRRARRPLRYDGPAEEAALAEAYRACAFTVYPSILEGFGLPVLESLAYGKPCVCSAAGALGESARGGGCLALPAVDAANLAAAIDQLLTEPATLERLAAEARARKFRTWTDYTCDLGDWMGSLTDRKFKGSG